MRTPTPTGDLARVESRSATLAFARILPASAVSAGGGVLGGQRTNAPMSWGAAGSGAAGAAVAAAAVVVEAGPSGMIVD